MRGLGVHSIIVAGAVALAACDGGDAGAKHPKLGEFVRLATAELNRQGLLWLGADLRLAQAEMHLTVTEVDVDEPDEQGLEVVSYSNRRIVAPRAAKSVTFIYAPRDAIGDLGPIKGGAKPPATLAAKLAKYVRASTSPLSPFGVELKHLEFNASLAVRPSAREGEAFTIEIIDFTGAAAARRNDVHAMKLVYRAPTPASPLDRLKGLTGTGTE